MTKDMTLAALSKGRDNNLALIRLLAATAVVLTHAYPPTADPIRAILGRRGGDLGVDVFFVVSGFLVAKSLASKDTWSFAWARVMRIFPALWVSTLLLVLVCGIVFSPLPTWDFWTRSTTLSYLAKNLTILPGIGSQPLLPYAFGASATEVNVPLWTLPYELQMYALLALLGLCGALRRPWLVISVALIGALSLGLDASGAFHPMDDSRARFVYLFFSGTTYYVLRDKIPMRGWLFAVCILTLAWVRLAPAGLRTFTLFALVPYMTLWLAFMPGGFVRQFNRVGDYSYGTYIFAFPVHALIVSRMSVTPLEDFGLTMVITLPLAALSWHFLESRALKIAPPWPRRLLEARGSAI